MTFRKHLVVPVALLFAVASLSAFQAKPADLTATWTGTLTPDGAPQGGPAHLVLTQKGGELTGTCGPSASNQTAIAKGKVTTVKGVTSATFESTQNSGAVMKFDLKIVEGRLKGGVTIEAPDGQKRTGALDVGRAK